MKTLVSLVLAVALLALAAVPAEAHHGGFRSRGVHHSGGGGASVTVVNSRAGIFGLRRQTTVVVNGR